jgi:hypothetical protein
MEHKFAQLKDATPKSFASIFLTFLDDNLLKLNWNDSLKEHGWQYSSSPRRTIAGGVFDKQTILFYLAKYVWIQGNYRRPDERFQQERNLRSAFEKASRHFTAQFPDHADSTTTLVIGQVWKATLQRSDPSLEQRKPPIKKNH